MTTKSKLQRNLFASGLMLLLVLAGSLAWQYYGQATKPRLVRTTAALVWVDPSAPASFKAPIQTFVESKKSSLTFVHDKAQADFVITPEETSTSWPIMLPLAGQPTTLKDANLVEPASVPSFYLYDQTGRFKWGQDLAAAMLAATKPATWTLTAIGDIIIGRTVYTKMLAYSDTNHPFLKWADRLKSTDLTLADLENAFSDSQAITSDTGMSFVSPLLSSSGLSLSGIDAVNLANNHSYNGGSTGFVDTMDVLKKNNIGYFGGGHNKAEAHQALIRNVNGTKVAMLGYTSIVGSVAATSDTPGQAYISMAPWGDFSEDNVAQMESDIRTAKKLADVVLVYYHWGTEYTHEANADQRLVAHRAVDAGASMIIGTHPHWVQGVEWYHGHLITYSLGNFVFDQEWSTETKQGTLLSATFTGSALSAAKLTPYIIDDYNQPRDSDEATAATILKNVYANSWWNP